jgi:hypothetical protein
MDLSDNPLRKSAANPRKMNGIVSARKAKNENPVAVVFSTLKTLRPRTQKNW